MKIVKIILGFLAVFFAFRRRRKKIFIVEDSKAYAQSLELFLTSKFSDKAEIQTFPVGETCLLELDRNPEIVIIDYFLSSRYDDAENGLETIRRIRARRPKTRIVLLSSHDNMKVVREATMKYDCKYIHKDNEAFRSLEGYLQSALA